MLKIRRPLGRLIFNMGIAIPGKTVFLIETAPSRLNFDGKIKHDLFTVIIILSCSLVIGNFEKKNRYSGAIIQGFRRMTSPFDESYSASFIKQDKLTTQSQAIFIFEIKTQFFVWFLFWLHCELRKDLWNIFTHILQGCFTVHCPSANQQITVTS